MPPTRLPEMKIKNGPIDSTGITPLIAGYGDAG